MNKKLKPALFLTVLTILLQGQAIAQQPKSTSTPPQPTTVTAIAIPANVVYPPGYTALIIDLVGIETRMTMEQKMGKGAYWPEWLRPGLSEGNSMYWWVLAKWHHNAGNKDIAYRSLVTAWVLTRIENRMCQAKDMQMSSRLLKVHEDILAAGTTKNSYKQEAVLYAINMAESFLSKGTPLRGMSCNIDPARKALEDQRKQLERWKKDAAKAVEDGRRPPIWRPEKPRALIDFKVWPRPEDRTRALKVQTKELGVVTEELQGKRARETADINTIMQMLNDTKPH